MSVEVSPDAANRPGKRGTSTERNRISRSSNPACSGPAPPKATRVKSLGSIPRCTET